MIKRIISVVVIALVILACSKSDDSNSGNGGGGVDTFNRGAMLTNIADNIIIPAYQDFSADINGLVTAKDNFVATPNQSNLEALRTSWYNAYKTWQYLEMFNIGKAEEIQYSFKMNVFPTNTSDIENNIASGTYDLLNVNNNDAVGFPAVDYMLYGVANGDTAILNVYANANYKTYLSDLVNQMQSLTNTVYTDWTTSYRNTFIASTENTASSAVNKLVNDFIFYYEKGLRANKIGIPAGVFSSTALPSKVEAVYREDISKTLVIDALQAVQDVFNGVAYNGSTSGESFKTYLEALNRSELVTLINSRFNTAKQKLQGLDANLKSQVMTDNTKMTEAYDALQLAVVSLKVDMLQAFNVSVDYVDADGD